MPARIPGSVDPLTRLHGARSAFREAQHTVDLARRELLEAERGVHDLASRSTAAASR